MSSKVVFIDQAKNRLFRQKPTFKAAVPEIASPDVTRKEFDETYAAFAERFQPLTPGKEQWIREAVGASIMRGRLTQLETDMLNRSGQILETVLGDAYRERSGPERIALAFQEESQFGSLELVYKRMEEADKVFHRALRKLMRLQKGAA